MGKTEGCKGCRYEECFADLAEPCYSCNRREDPLLTGNATNNWEKK